MLDNQFRSGNFCRGSFPKYFPIKSFFFSNKDERKYKLLNNNLNSHRPRFKYLFTPFDKEIGTRHF